MSTPTLGQLKRGLAISEQIATLQAELAAIFTGKAAPQAPASVKTDGRTGKRSPQTIAKMKAAQKARWAAKKGSQAA